jgi:hypothetical protein
VPLVRFAVSNRSVYYYPTLASLEPLTSPQLVPVAIVVWGQKQVFKRNAGGSLIELGYCADLNW